MSLIGDFERPAFLGSQPQTFCQLRRKVTRVNHLLQTETTLTKAVSRQRTLNSPLISASYQFSNKNPSSEMFCHKLSPILIKTNYFKSIGKNGFRCNLEFRESVHQHLTTKFYPNELIRMSSIYTQEFSNKFCFKSEVATKMPAYYFSQVGINNNKRKMQSFF